jgi:site-specific DNA-methyltransferase (cytosine-N4-specific)
MEIAALAEQKPRGYNGGFSTKPFPNWEAAALRTTYCEKVKDRFRHVIPIQTQLERSDSRGINRQRTRYSSHGLHEYKGKFNPQVVRAVGNIMGLAPGSRVLDPFCGSGTVLVESIHNGWNARGLDINPLAIIIAEAKVRALRISARELRSALKQLTEMLAPWEHLGAFGRRVSGKDQALIEKAFRLSGQIRSDSYLSSWFPRDVLLQLEMLFAVIDRLTSVTLQRIFKVIISDHLREVSHQDDADLRIRRRKSPLVNAPLVSLVMKSANSRLFDVITASDLLGDQAKAVDVAAEVADSRRPFKSLDGAFDAIITSPPYAMALPYIDTQRLSLAALGLSSSRLLGTLEKQLIGSREISTQERRSRELLIRARAQDLPRSVSKSCRSLLRSLDSRDGFRRQNLPALLHRYFTGMRAFMISVQPYLKSGGQIAMVVGKNETTIGGKRQTIDTPELLADTAESVGYSVSDVLALDVYQRFGLHAANGIRRESLVLLRC